VISFSEGLIEGTIPTWLGLNFMGWMGLSALEQWSQTVWAGNEGLEIRSVWGRRRVAWKEVERVYLKDIGKTIASSNEDGDLPKIKFWKIEDANGREILSLDVVSVPKDQFQQLIERAQLEAGLGGRSQGAAG